MLEYSDGFLFVGLDGYLYLATFDADGEGYYSSDQPWTVSWVRAEWWGNAYPNDEEE